jgi:hypothetical protein
MHDDGEPTRVGLGGDSASLFVPLHTWHVIPYAESCNSILSLQAESQLGSIMIYIHFCSRSSRQSHGSHSQRFWVSGLETEDTPKIKVYLTL